MPRTTAEAVKLVLGNDYDRSCAPSLRPFLDTAAAAVDRLVRVSTDDGFAALPAEWELVERWLAAYYYTLSDPTYKSRSDLGASGTFNRDGTEYMKGARAADPSGLLDAVLAGRAGVATAAWLGTPDCDRRPYDRW